MSGIQGTKSHLRDEAHETIRQQEVKSLASAAMLDHSLNHSPAQGLACLGAHGHGEVQDQA